MYRHLFFANQKAGYMFIFGGLLVVLVAMSWVARKKTLKSFAHDESLKDLLFLDKRTLFRHLLLLCVWVFATLSLMQPAIKKPYQHDASLNTQDEEWQKNDEKLSGTVKRRLCDVIFLLDTSVSMSVEDTRQKVSRLEVAREIVDEVLQKLDGQNVALYAFTSTLTPVVPITLDYLFTRLMLQDIGLNYGDVAGTDLMESLDSIGQRHLVTPSMRQKVVVLLTDGGDTYLSSLEKGERKKQEDVFLEKLNFYQEHNVRLFTVGLGSQEGRVVPDIEYEGAPVISSLDTGLLKQLSAKGRGQFFFANDYSSLEIAETITKVMRSENTLSDQEVKAMASLKQTVQIEPPQIRNYYQWPLGFALVLLALELLLPRLPHKQKEIS